MEDFISLTSDKTEPEEVDVLKLTADSPQPMPPPPVKEDITDNKRSADTIKPFYPTCKRVLTRAPWMTRKRNSPDKPTNKEEGPEPCPRAEEPPGKPELPDPTLPSKLDNTTLPTKPTSSVGALSLQQLMSVEEEVVEPVGRKKRRQEGDGESERVARLRNMLKQAEAEKLTLQGYVADLQAKLAAVPKRASSKGAESQTDQNGVECPMCASNVEPSILLSTFGEDFSYDQGNKKFVQKSSGFFYNPHTQLYHCQENDLIYYWDASHSIYHYQSKVAGAGGSVGSSGEEEKEREGKGEEEEGSEEEGEISEPNQSVSDDLKEAVDSAMKQNGVEFIPSLNMYFNKHTGLHYCQSSGLYYDTKMSVFYTLADGKYTFHSTTKPDDTKSAYAKTSIRAVVKETSCHKVKQGDLYIFTCMGGTIGREGSHEIVLPEIRVSKRHATISYCSDKYYITDEGTVNGTFLNSKRLSVQKESSERHELSHLDEIRLGSTTLQLHIHTNQATCNWCEPGLNPNIQNNKPPLAGATISEPPALYKQHNREMNRLKRKLLGK